MQLLQARMNPSFCMSGEGRKNRGEGEDQVWERAAPHLQPITGRQRPLQKDRGPHRGMPSTALVLPQGHQSLEGLEGDEARLG